MFEFEEPDETMKKLLIITLHISIGIVGMFTIGCASILSESNYPVTFRSNPNQADIIITNKSGREIFRGKTPATVTLPAGDGFFKGARYDVTASKNGYQESKGALTPDVDEWYIGNILFGGLVGILIVDPLTGAMYELPPEFTINLTKIDDGQPLSLKSGVVHISDLPENLRSKLIPLK